MNKPKKRTSKCPHCNTTNVTITENGLTCNSCGFVNDKNKVAQFVTYDNNE